jgi:hypothetical protein
MSEPGSLIPSDEQAKLGQEALRTLRAIGGFLRQAVGTYPEDLVGYYLGGDWLKVRRAENLVRIVQEMQERLKARNVSPERPSISVALPLLIAAADEDRQELQDLWARLLAAAADPKRTKSFRGAFIDVAKKMDPLDAVVLQLAGATNRVITGTIQNALARSAGRLTVASNRAQVDVGNDSIADTRRNSGATWSGISSGYHGLDSAFNQGARPASRPRCCS